MVLEQELLFSVIDYLTPKSPSSLKITLAWLVSDMRSTNHLTLRTEHVSILLSNWLMSKFSKPLTVRSPFYRTVQEAIKWSFIKTPWKDEKDPREISKYFFSLDTVFFPKPRVIESSNTEFKIRILKTS